MNKIYCAIFFLLLTACAGPTFKYGPAELAKWNQQKLNQQFLIGASRFDEVKKVFGDCSRVRFTGEDTDNAVSDIKSGRNLVCTYRYLIGNLPDCAGSAACNPYEVGLSDYQETSAVFEFDANGWLKKVDYSHINHLDKIVDSN